MIFNGKTVDGKPETNWPEIYRFCSNQERFIVEVRKLDPEREISLQQMKYFHAVVIPLFVEYTGDSPQYWENKLKLECGSKWFQPKIVTVDGKDFAFLPSKKKLSVADFSEWYQNITDYGLSVNVVIPPPDPRWREHQTPER